MMRRFFCTLVVLVGWLPVASLAQQYWLTVGSYQSIETAEKARAQAAANLIDAFAVMGAQTDRGYFYRVVSGPFMTRALADERRTSAREQGYPQAWIWIDATASFTPLPGDADDSAMDFETSQRAYSTYDYGTAVDSLYADDGETRAAALIDKRSTPPVLVDEAPPGYQLNKMRRER